MFVGAGTSPRTVNRPTDWAVGDLFVLQVSLANDIPTADITVPFGFTLLPDSVQAGNNNIRLYAKTAAADEPANYSVSWVGGGNGVLTMTAFYSEIALPIVVDAVASQSNASGDRLWPSVTFSDNGYTGGLLACFAILSTNTATTPDSRMVERQDTSTTPRPYIMTQDAMPAGATGTRTGTGSASVNKTVSVALLEEGEIPGPQVQATAVGTAGTTTPTVSKPASVAAGDLLVAQVSMGSTSGLVSAVPEGFAVISGTNLLGTATGSNMVLYSKIATGAEPDSYQFTTTQNANVSLMVLRSPSALPIIVNEDVAYLTATDVTDRVWPSIDIINPNSLLTCFAAYSTNTQTTPDARMLERWDTLVSTHRTYLMTQAVLPSTGATGTRTGTGASIGNLITVSVAFAEEEAEPPPPLEELQAPTELTAIAGGTTQIQLSWSDSNVSEDGFEVERSPDAETWAVIATTTDTSHLDTGLDPSTTYHYRVRSYRVDP
jgi:hypothetical protein